METKGRLIVLTGKTASGKDTVLRQLLSKFPLHKIITTTSRPPREGEKSGIDYNFISEDEFKRKIQAGDFIEYVSYGGNLYGTEKKEILAHLDQNLIWRVDPSLAGQARHFLRKAFEAPFAEILLQGLTVIYLTAPDEVILQRLKKRGSSEAEIKKRMEDDAEFWQKYQETYDFVVENKDGELNETVEKICRIIVSANPPL